MPHSNLQRPPCIALLVTSASLTFSTFMASIPLLPTILKSDDPVRGPSICIIMFLLPALLLHPLISRFPVHYLLSTLPVPCLLSTFASLFIALISHFQIWYALRRIALFLVFLLLGAAFSSLQAVIIRLIYYSLIESSPPSRRHGTGLHLAFLEASITVTSVLTPPIFVFFFEFTTSPSSPYYLITVVQVLITAAVYIKTCTSSYPSTDVASLSVHSRISPEFTPLLNGLLPNPGISSSQSQESSKVIYTLMRHPWAWFVLLTTFTSTASLAFLRPLLTPYDQLLNHATLMHASTLFSLLGLVTFMTELVMTVGVAERIGIRNTLMAGLLFTAGAFRLLSKPHFPLAITLVMATIGSAATHVVALTELARTTNLPVETPFQTTPLVVAAFLTFAEIIGTIAAMLFPDTKDPSFFSTAISQWSLFLFLTCLITGIPYILGLIFQCVAPVFSLFTSLRDELALHRTESIPTSYIPTPSPTASHSQRSMPLSATPA